MRRAAILALAILAGCRPSATPPRVPAAAPQAARAPDDASPLRFAWPAGIEAQVTERVLKKERHATMRYRITVEADADALLVYYRDFAFVELEGFDLADPSVRKEIAALEEQLSTSIPPYRVARDGTWIGAVGLETLSERFSSVFTAKSREALASMLANPKLRALVDAKMREVWQAWAEGWIGLSLAVGQEQHGLVAVEVAGARVELPFTVERLAADDGIRLRATQTMEGEPALRLMGAIVEELAASMADAPGKSPPFAGTQVRRVHVRDATLDPKTLLPRRASTRLTTSVTFEGKTKEQLETHEWVFEWAAP